MFEWLSENWGSILVCTILAVILTAIIVYIIRNKRKGKNSCSCGCGCSSCAMKDTCHVGIEETKPKD